MKKQIPRIHAYITDFGVTRLSPRSEAWLDARAPNWERYLGTTKDRKCLSKRKKNLLNRFESAIKTCAEIAWHSGDELQTF